MVLSATLAEYPARALGVSSADSVVCSVETALLKVP